MADVGSSIFNKKATEKLRSPDDLDKYVQVTNPAVWIALLGCVALIAGLLAWGAFGTVMTNVGTSAAVVKNSNGTQVVCFLPYEQAFEVSEGDDADVNGTKMKVASVASVPISTDEAREILGNDFLASSLVPGDWSYLVTLEGDASELPEGVPSKVNITVNRVAPISLVLGQAAS